MRAIAAAAAFVLAIILLVAGIDPVPTWFFVFAWYPTVVLLDEWAHANGQPRALTRLPLVLSLFGWSAIVWLFFEAANFLLDNWYYVFLPRHPVERWAGVLLAFATVLPAIFFAERALGAAGVGKRWLTKPFSLGSRDLHYATLLGALQFVLSLAWPRTFFPLIWGAMFLLCEPYVFRRRPDLSLFADLARGDWGRTGRLFFGGLGIGMLWESYNYWARGKWVYTVPWLEHTKWFEMPPFGFVGFAFFALEAWSMYAALCAAGVALDLTPSPSSPPAPLPWRGGISGLKTGRTKLAVLAATVFAVATLVGMERWTISSVVPRLADLPAVDSSEAVTLSRAGIRTPFALALSDPPAIERAGLPPGRSQSAKATARLAVLRGIGAFYAGELEQIGISDVCMLSEEDPFTLWTALHLNLPEKRPTQAEVRVWVGGARKACA